jgi:hypothetical protein
LPSLPLQPIKLNIKQCLSLKNEKATKILKNHVKNKSPDNYEELKKTIDNIIKYKISKNHLKNYFNYLFTQANDFINKN